MSPFNATSQIPLSVLPLTDPTSENLKLKKKKKQITNWAMSIFIQVYRNNNNNNNMASLLPCQFIHVYRSNIVQ
jgi:hypothetical protein